MKHRGLYNQAEGNETRSNAEFLIDRIAENTLIEGEHVARLRAMAVARSWTALDGYVKKNLTGFSRARIDSMITSAMAGVRL